MSDQNMNTDPGTEEDTASGGAPEQPDNEDITTDEQGKPLDNPSGG